MVDHYRGKDIGSHVISLEAIASLCEIHKTNDGIEIGACVTMDQIEQSTLIKEHAFSLWQSAAELGGPQTRNRATIGGNIASGAPSADCAAPLLALGAELRIVGPAGVRTLPIAELFVGVSKTSLKKGELIASILLPGAQCVSRFKKVGKRSALAISCINMAVVRRTEDGRDVFSIAVGAAAPTPRLCPKTMAILNSTPCTAACMEKACQAILTEIAPIDDRWGSAEYRRMVCVNLLKALIQETKEGLA